MNELGLDSDRVDRDREAFDQCVGDVQALDLAGGDYKISEAVI